jgi:flagellar protein FlaG
MVTHVALQKLPTNLTELRPQRAATAAYTSTAGEATAPQALEQAREQPAGSVPPVDPKLLDKAVKQLTEGVQNLQRSLQFSVDGSTGRTVIKVVDKETQQVIRQIPEEHVLELAARMEQATGKLVKDEA